MKTSNTKLTSHRQQQRSSKARLYTSLLALGGSLFASMHLGADDTDVYLRESNLPAEQTRPNMVFILDTSGSMGEPISPNASGNYTRWQEANRYDSNEDYPGEENYAGGPGDSNYLYLYRMNDSYHADPYIYYNKVHISQIDEDDCEDNLQTNHRTNDGNNGNGRRINSGFDSYLYGDPANLGNWQPMCAESDPSCGFVAGPTGPKVDCRSDRDYISNFNSFPRTNTNQRKRDNGIWAFNENVHNYLQGYYRFTVLMQVMRDIIDDEFDVNMSIMRFNGGDGGYVLHESVLATDAANKASLRAIIPSLEPSDTTPLAEALWEAGLYLRGEQARYGTWSGAATASAAYQPSTTRYDSPIDYACQKSHIVLLTDGRPYRDDNSDSDISGLISGSCSHSNNANNTNQSCLDDLADWLSYDSSTATGRRDHITNSTLPNEQPITVHTIGFGLNTPLLQATATDESDGGLNKTAYTAAELREALADTASSAEFESDVTVAPAVAVNAYSGLQHREEVYFALFEPNSSPRWSGNVKKYRFVDGIITDANGSAAIDTSTGGTGTFYEDAESEWNTPRDFDGDGEADFDADGDDIALGGTATQLTTPTSRKIYTYTGDPLLYNASGAPTAEALNGENLDLNSSNSITNNSAIAADPTLLGASVTTTAYAQEIIDWVRGGTTDAVALGTTSSDWPNYFFADVMHNPPIVITYETDTSSGSCSEEEPCFTDVLYAGSNMGTFHAIDTESGDELWSFVPKELLPNLTTYYENTGGFTDKVYGLDGEIQVWRNDVNGDGTINGADHVYLYQPMRRGGSSIYAFDVTDADSPELLWQIDAADSGAYEDLAQTWSAPQRTRINWCESATDCSEREVLFFGGGYDPIHDAATTTPETSGKGNAIYMVDAITSELIWSAGDNSSAHSFDNANMRYSFAADLFVADVDGDKLVDFVYGVDITGNVWRFDFPNSESAGMDASDVDGGLVAELGGSGGFDFRRFYNAPDVAFFSPRGKSPFLTISVASGHRADPREEDLDDFLYVFFDPYATIPAPNYDYDDGSSTIAANEIPEVGSSPSDGSAPLGWKLPLEGSGEKSLSQTVTFDGVILMTTYTPDSTDSCVGSLGSGRLYILNALTGESRVAAFSEDADESSPNYINMVGDGIPPEPALIFGSTEVCVSNCGPDAPGDPVMSETTKVSACVGLECFEYQPVYEGERVYWRENK